MHLHLVIIVSRKPIFIFIFRETGNVFEAVELVLDP